MQVSTSLPAKLKVVLLTTCLALSACSQDYPLVANGYTKTAELSALDHDGRGNFALPIPPKSCLLAFRKMPKLTTMAIRVVIENEVDVTYDSAAIMKALGNEDFSKGIFVVDAAGLRFEKGYDCDSDIR